MNKTGTYVKNLSGIASYESFRPTPLQDIKVDLDQEALDLLIKARTSLAFLEGYSQAIVALDVFVGSYVQKEALLSSQIEGTQATIEDILDIQSGVSTNLDVIEVVNYVKAMEHAMSIRKDLPLCNRFIKEIHYQLMSSGRGEDKTPGEFRVSQNWVGKAKSNLKTALYIPPNVEDMNQALNDLENFLNNPSLGIDPLVVNALVHYQFETIHPFLDGNGRVGRMLINLMLIDSSLLSKPSFYISLFFKQNQNEYYARLNFVRNEEDYLGWIKFFLKGIEKTANSTIESIKRLQALRIQNINAVKGRDEWLLTLIEKYPVFSSTHVAKMANKPYDAVNRSILRLVKQNIVSIVNTSKKKRTYGYLDYIHILKDE